LDPSIGELSMHTDQLGVVYFTQPPPAEDEPMPQEVRPENANEPMPEVEAASAAEPAVKAGPADADEPMPKAGTETDPGGKQGSKDEPGGAADQQPKRAKLGLLERCIPGSHVNVRWLSDEERRLKAALGANRLLVEDLTQAARGADAAISALSSRLEVFQGASGMCAESGLW
jgi:hypothetical protein